VASPQPPAHSEGLYRAAMFNVGAALATTFPLRFLRGLAAFAGGLYALTHAARVAIVEKNLQLLDCSHDAKSARRVYREFGKTMADYFYIGTRPAQEAVRIVTKRDGEEHLHAVAAMGKGGLIVTAHFGLFELGGLLLAESGLRSVVLTYPEPSAALTKWRTDFRRRWKVETLEVGTDSFAFLKIAEQWRAGTFVAALIDRPHATDQAPVNFPNGASAFSTGILLLAAHAGVPVIPATMVRRDDGSYHARILEPIIIQPRASRAETLRIYSQQIADKLIPLLKAHPGQWYQFVPLSPLT
jgi:lauroyl/myristoyl acyltransferase